MNASVEDMPTTPIAPRGPSGLLSLPSRPLPAIAKGSNGLLAARPGLKEDTATRQKAVMARATMILTGSFVVGRILGLLRTSLFAYVFGTSPVSDAYLQAFFIPDLIFNVVAGGALSSAFIPVFTHYMIGEKDPRAAWRIASSALNLALAIMCVLALIAMLLAPWLVPLYNPHVSAEEMGLIISLTRIMLFQSIIMGGGVIVNSVLYARQNFLLPAIGTVLYNVGLIVGLDSHRGSAPERFVAPGCEPLEPLGLGQQDTPKTALDFAFRDDLRQARKDKRPSRQTEVGMRSKLVHALGDNPAAQRRRRVHRQAPRRGILFVEDGLELRIGDRLFGDQALKRVQMLASLGVRPGRLL